MTVEAADVHVADAGACDSADDSAFDAANMQGEELVSAVRFYGCEAVDALVQAVGKDLATRRLAEAVDARGNTAMHMCAANGDTDAVLRLGELCPQLAPSANTDGNTPLHWACVAGHLSVVQALHGTFKAPTAVENAFGRTPICEAQQHGRVAVLEYFVSTLGREDGTANAEAVVQMQE